MNLTVGEKLKVARQKQNLSLEEVAAKLHIRIRFLTALEEDQREQLPSLVQGKGFLRMYAGYLGLSENALCAEWDDSQAITFEPVEQNTPKKTKEGNITEAIKGIRLPQGFHLPASLVSSLGRIGNRVKIIQIPQKTKGEKSTLSQEEAETLEGMNDPVRIPASQQFYLEMGQILKQRRESLHLTLDDVERYTKLRIRYLQALEDGDMASLPSIVQGKGMLSNYAIFLNLDVEPLLVLFANALQTKRVEGIETSDKPNSEKSRSGPMVAPAWKKLITPDLLIGSSIILVLFLFAIWGISQISAVRANDAQSTAPSVADVLLITETPTITSLMTNVSTSTKTPSSAIRQEDLLPGEVAAIVQPDQASNSESSSEVPVLGDSPIQVYVIARQRTFLRVIVDRKEAFTGRTVPGNAYPFNGEDRIELVGGNATALQVYFNQNELRTLGLPGQAVNLIFTKDGMITPTPHFSPTPTNTPLASLTLQPSPTQPTSTVTPFIPTP